MADNFRFSFTSDKNLEKIMELAFSDHKTAAAAFAIREGRPSSIYDGEWGSTPVHTRLVFYWAFPEGDRKDLHKFPSKISYTTAATIAKNWLDEVEYGEEPDQDGTNRKGFHIYNETWGHVDNDPYAFVAIRPAWIMYGK